MQSSVEKKIVFDSDLIEDVKEWCESHSISVSAFVRKAVEMLFKRVTKKEEGR